MAWTVSTLSLVIFGGAAVALAVAVGALRERPDPLAVPLAVMMFAAAYWATVDAISMGFADGDRVLFWYRLRYPGVVTAPMAYAAVALRYAGNDRWVTRRRIATLAVIPVVTVAVVWTNQFHGFFWESVSVSTVFGAAVVDVIPGPWYWVNLVYLYLVAFVTFGVLGSMAVRAGRMYRKQATVMFVAGVLPLVMNAVTVFGIGPDLTVDLTTVGLTGAGLLVALALFHFNLVEVRPVARDRLLEELDDGVVVVGPDGRIREYNPTAAAIFEDIEINQPAEEVLTKSVAPDGGEIVVETDEGRRLYHTRSTPLLDDRRGKSGHIVYLNDVTEIVEREQRVGVLNRILRHNVRNELNVAIGHLDLLEEEVAADSFEHGAKAQESLDRVLSLAKKARDVERTLQDGETSVTTSATNAVDRAADAAEDRFPGAELTLQYVWSEETDGAAGEVDREVPVEVVEEELLDMALKELVENAVEHNDRDTPAVTIRLEPGDDEVRIQVVDGGPTIPEQEITVLRSWRETGLKHGSGLGLWLVRWTATLSSGKLSFQTGRARGNVVTLTLPAAE